MATTKVTIDPITRIEGHLKIEVEVEEGKVTDAHAAGEITSGRYEREREQLKSELRAWYDG